LWQLCNTIDHPEQNHKNARELEGAS
jgi:hypothetical protein